jgi:hypothetical protein
MKQGILKMKNCSVIRGIRFTPIINDAERVWRAAKELNNIGVELADIELLIGKEDAAKLDAATGEHGFLAKVARIGLEIGNKDIDYLVYYLAGLHQPQELCVRRLVGTEQIAELDIYTSRL